MLANKHYQLTSAKKITLVDVNQKHRPKNSLGQCRSKKKNLIDVRQKTSLVDVSKKIISTNIDQKLASTKINQKQPQCLLFCFLFGLLLL